VLAGAGVGQQQPQLGKEERKMGRGGDEGGGYEATHQYLPLHDEEEEGEEEGEYIRGECEGNDDDDEDDDEGGGGEGGKSPRAQHRHQYRNRKYRRLAQNPSSQGLGTMSSSYSNSSLFLGSSSARRSRSNSMGRVGGEEVEGEEGASAATAAAAMPVNGMYPSGGGLGKQFLFRPPQPPATNGSSSSSSSSNNNSKCSGRTRPKRGGSSSNGGAAATPASSSSGRNTRNRRRAALKAEEAIQRAQGGNEGGSEEEAPSRRSNRRRNGNDDDGSEDEDEDEDEEGGEGELDEALMNLRFPPQHETDFVGAVFKLGLKCSSPKVLMDLMPMTETLTTEHIKSHLQKYRLHGHRSKEEFVEVRSSEGGRRGREGGTVSVCLYPYPIIHCQNNNNLFLTSLLPPSLLPSLPPSLPPLVF